jgi:hypothetical protein
VFSSKPADRLQTATGKHILWQVSMQADRIRQSSYWGNFSTVFYLNLWWVCIQGCIQKFLDRVNNKINNSNTCWEATQRVLVAKLIRLTHKIAIQLHLVAESCTICSSCSRWPVRKLLDTPSYILMYHS